MYVHKEQREMSSVLIYPLPHSLRQGLSLTLELVLCPTSPSDAPAFPYSDCVINSWVTISGFLLECRKFEQFRVYHFLLPTESSP